MDLKIIFKSKGKGWDELAVKTLDNVMTAFAGESQANRKYTAFAKQAEKEGFPKVANLFRAAADAEAIHAGKLLDVADKVQSTADNLATAAAGERYEFEEMYPAFVKAAEEENQNAAARVMKLAMEAEKVHEALYTKAQQFVAEGKDMTGEGLYLCPVCGWIGTEPAPEKCPICNTLAKSFKKYE